MSTWLPCPYAADYRFDIGHVRDLGNGHAVIEYAAPWGRPVASPVPAWGETGGEETATCLARLEARFGTERAERIARLNRNMVIFPNLVLNDIMAVVQVLPLNVLSGVMPALPKLISYVELPCVTTWPL